MFHTFQSSVAPKSAGIGDGTDGSKTGRSTGSRRISTSNACVECRRRKIRCDGLQPCGQCQWYQHPKSCAYAKPAQRVVPSRKLVEKLNGSIEQYRIVLSRLIPNRDIDSLVNLPREDLLDLVLSNPPGVSSNSPSASYLNHNSDLKIKPDEDTLEGLEEAPYESPEWDEARRHLKRVQGISDDINGLAMSNDKHSSYVGISSVPAALKVIMKVAPYTEPYIVAEGPDRDVPSRSATPPPEVLDSNPNALPSTEDGNVLIESYFTRVHPFFPMIDEQKFRTTYRKEERTDSPWLALLNTVFALGSLAAGTSENETHTAYFTRSRHHLSLESFGSGSLEVLQAMGIMSGYYMHYLNRPNEAHALMGGTLRMATSLGLHREYMGSAAARENVDEKAKEATSADMRRRIWWSLFCLDSWASTTTGRPSLGRIGDGITVMPPGKVAEAQDSPSYTDQNSEESLKVLPLIHFSSFCKIATKIQDRLIAQPVLRSEEINKYDADLVKWHNELPSILLNLTEEVPEFLRVPRLVMKWRYHNLRMVLHRPILLAAALRRGSFDALSPEEKLAIDKCRAVAASTIEDISSECTADLVSGWNGVWLCYQACMVPLVSLFSDTSAPEEAEKWVSQLETALEYFDRMTLYSVAAKKSKEAIAKLLEAYKVASAAQRQLLSEQQEQERLKREASYESPPPETARHTQQNVQQQEPMPLAVQAPQQMIAFDQFNGLDSFEATPQPMSTIAEYPYTTGPTQIIGSQATSLWGGTSESNTNISGFWDEMMWEENIPEVAPTGGMYMSNVIGDFNVPSHGHMHPPQHPHQHPHHHQQQQQQLQQQQQHQHPHHPHQNYDPRLSQSPHSSVW